MILSRFLFPLLFATAALAEPRYSFLTTPGKLPKEVLPKHYVLRIEPRPDNDGFAGRAEIEINASRAVPSITLNAAGLGFASVVLVSGGKSQNLKAQFDARRETATLVPESGPIAAGDHRLVIDYVGSIGRHPQGFYRIDYKLREAGGSALRDKVMLATQMEPVHARKLFPGWDEPAFRASFEITAVAPAGHTVVSNMPVIGETPLPGGRKEVAFLRSVSMPTYLVALFIGEMDVLEDSVDGIPLGIYTAKGKQERARYAMAATKQVVRWFHEYFDVRYALPKLDQIALPGGIGGAMENWGAVAYNEGRLLVDADAALRQKQSVYGIIAHELAHQWFGNLVTMAWWDNLWLNEGFAQWMQTKAQERFHPEWSARLRSHLWRQWAMTEDARRTTHPIQTPVENDARAMDVFDAITYAKGEAFIWMLEDYLGEAAFREGIRRYMSVHRFSNTTTADLWHHLSQASGRDVAQLAAAWTGQPGFPLVRAAQACKGGVALVTLTQERFTLNDPRALRLTWNVPVTLLGANGERQTVLLQGAPAQARLKGCGPVLANAGNIGYFRVQYDAATFKRIAAGLPGLPAQERFRLLADTFALVQAGRLGAGDYLALVDRLGAETDASVWDHVINALRFLRDLMDAPADRANFDARIAHLLRAPMARIGWDAKPGEGGDIAPLRRSLIDALGRAGDAATVHEARKRHAARQLDPAIRPAILNVVGRHADAAAYEALLRELRATTEVEVRWQYQSALRQLADPSLLRRWMEALLRTDELAPGDAVFNLNRIGGDSGQFDTAWEFVKANLAAIYAKASPRGRTWVLAETAAPFADEARAEELLVLARANLEPAERYQSEKAADWIRLKAQVKAREAARAALWARAQ